jgi:hypothetical protein
MLAAVSAGILLMTSLTEADDSTPPTAAAQVSPSLNAAELDQLTAPIALYPDPLIAQILMAATYPLEVVEAARWLEVPANAQLKGDLLATALQQQSWDLSVKSLVPFPELLGMMNMNLQWTERIGDAFLAQQAGVMDSIQRLRQHAMNAGSLTSTPQQTVASDDGNVTIEPASPDVVYVPYYNPLVAFGPWAWTDYPPFYFGIPPGIFFGDAVIGFGIGFGIVGPLWGWNSWDWRGRGINIGHPRVPRYPSPRPGPWQHDPAHRRGVPYRDAATATRFLGQNAATRREFRGFPGESPTRVAPPSTRMPEVGRPSQRGSETAPRAPIVTPGAPPAFESFGQGPRTRDEAARGFSSRSAPSSAPSPRGGGRPR